MQTKAQDKKGLLFLNDLQTIAKLNRGACLSKEYINNLTHLLWRCNKGHTWEATPSSIKQGSWCPVCFFSKNKGSIEEIRELAKRKGGKCLSKEYVNSHSKLLFKCGKGHTWKTPPYYIKQGSWCPHCAGKVKGTIQGMRQMAKEKDGKCLSKKYVDSSTHLLWECKRRHRWKAMPNSVKQGSWCPICFIKSQKGSTIEEMKQLARDKGGKCLSEKYKNTKTLLTWKCKKDHVFKARPYAVKIHNFWCTKCSLEERKQHYFNSLKKIARSKGGKCLSKQYTNYFDKLVWQCEKGHTWKTTSYLIKKGTWCTVCWGKKKGTIEKMQEMAKAKGGKCLSKEYINNRTHLLWQCAKGHSWKTTPSVIHDGSWCPICAGRK